MSTLQFETAEYAGTAPTCAVCKNPVPGSHYLLGAAVVCPTCRDLLLAHTRPAGPDDLVRGAALGAGAAVVGGGAWYAVSTLTGVEIGLLAIAVGWLVSQAVRRGSGGGGRPQQVLAVGLTYLAIVGTYVPELWVPGAGGTAVVLALATPVMLIANGDPSVILWFFIVGFALWYAWQRSAGVNLVFTGPFPGPSETP